MPQVAELVRSLKGERVQCRVCEHYCTLAPGEWGKCGVRVNRGGQIISTVYGKATAAHIDPIEKKPLYHFLPGESALSIGTYGCNMHCMWCQNAGISQVRKKDERRDSLGESLPPKALVEIAREQHAAAIAYTYNEPTVFFEYTYDTAKLAHAHGIKNIYVSNGFMTEAAIEKIEPYLDAINVDLKGFTPELYETYTGTRIEPVKRNIAKIAHETDIWIEVTTLIIPGLNDSDEELRQAAEWLASVNPLMPWHLSAFHPSHKMRDRPRTPPSTLARAYEIGREAGLQYIYVGNIYDPAHEQTRCHHCGTQLIQRHGFSARPQWRTPGICPQCGAAIPGVWTKDGPPDH